MPGSTDLATGLQAIHANHLEDLRRIAVWMVREYPVAPLEDETFLVQSNGIAQWLKLALAENPRDHGEGGVGIAAAMSFSLPSRFVWQVYRSVLGAEEVPTESPYDKQRLTWRLYRMLPELMQEAVFAPLARFLEGSEPERRRFQLAEKIADLFDQYQVFRADWLADWEQGEDRLIPTRGEPVALTEEQRWQAHLWRRLVAEMPEEKRATSRAHIHTRFLDAALTQTDRPQGLPRRVIVFGVSSLPQQTLEVLDTLGRWCQVVLCVHNPCAWYWADIVSDRDLLRADRHRGRVRSNLETAPPEDELHLHAQPLLAAWGKQGRDYIRLLDAFDNPEDYRAGFAAAQQRVDLFESPGDDCLLHQLQDDITELRPLSETRQQWSGPDPQQDRSIVFHVAHSPQREVEILHDQLLAALNADDKLRPRDIMVMVPDIDTYAPHIQAVFGRHAVDDPRHIPFTLSDQGQRHQVPLLIALEQLLRLPESRFGVSDILTLLEVPALQRHWGISDSDLPLLHRWIDQANVRWGLDEHQRQDLDLPEGLQRHTWAFGLSRMLGGYAIGGDGHWSGIEPASDVGGMEAALAGRLDRFVRTLGQFRQTLTEDATPTQWLSRVEQLKSTFFGDLEDRDLVAWERFQSTVEQWQQAAEDGGLGSEAVPLSIVRDVWLEGLDEGGLNQRFLAGKVNFATLMPMRAIPFRRICLLGMNDGDYPRIRPPMDFDLMARHYRPGDRSRREDDRYLFLEALLSAREQFYISWIGRSVRDNSVRPPSVLVGQLRDHLQQGWGDVVEALTTQHPLQPFSTDYFPAHNQPQTPVTEILSRQRLFTYDPDWRASHEPVADETDSPLSPMVPDEPITLSDLSRFLKRPVEAFYQTRLQIHFRDEDGSPDDAEPFELDGLARWSLQDELIREAILKAGDEDAFEHQLQERTEAMARRGDLGMGLTENALREQVTEPMTDLFRRYRDLCEQWPQHLEEPLVFEDVFATEHGNISVTGTIGQRVTNDQGRQARLIVSSSEILKDSGANAGWRYDNLLQSWVEHLAANALGTPMNSHILGKRGSLTLPPLEPDVARDHLAHIVTAWQQGMSEPLPLSATSGFAWLRARHKRGGDEDKAQREACKQWETDLQRDAGYLSRCWPDGEAAISDERFHELTHALYYPLWSLIQDA